MVRDHGSTSGTRALWDTGVGDWRTFRVDRVRLRTPGGPRFAPREAPDGGAVAHVLRGVGSTAWAHPARIRLHAPSGTVAARLAPTAGLLVDDGPDACVLETGGSSMAHLAGATTREVEPGSAR